MMPGKGLDSIVVKLSFEEVHIQSGEVLFWKHSWTAWKDAEHVSENAEFAAGNCTHVCSISNTYFLRNINYCEKTNEFVK